MLSAISSASRTESATRESYETLSDAALSRVTGGADPGYDPSNNAFGRAGPGQSWTWLGNYYTPEALAHDRSVRNSIQAGSSKPMAHVKALPLLPAAVGSYFRARFHPGADDVHLP
jgi:hypothetical protein